MNSIKCPHCGFVSSVTSGTCKGCGRPFGMNTIKPGSRPKTKFAVIALIGAVIGILIIGAIAWTASSVFTSKTLWPSETAAILNSHHEFNRPVTVKIPTALVERADRGDLDADALIENYSIGRVLKHLGLVTVDFTVNRDDTDAWTYVTKIKPVDPLRVDRASLIEKSQSLSNLPGVPPVPSRNGGSRESSDAVEIGSLELVEISDPLPSGPNTFLVAFKCRFRPNGLGEVFDNASEVHKAVPTSIAKKLDETLTDKRLSVGMKTDGSNSVDAGYAVVAKEGPLSKEWRIREISFNSATNGNFVYHKVNP